MFARQNWSLSFQHQLCDVTEPLPEVDDSVPSAFCDSAGISSWAALVVPGEGWRKSLHMTK